MEMVLLGIIICLTLRMFFEGQPAKRALKALCKEYRNKYRRKYRDKLRKYRKKHRRPRR